jgi:hypothetical protein
MRESRTQANDLGYGVVSECLSGNECDEIWGTLSAGTVSRSRAGARHLMSNPAVPALADDRRLTKLAKEWLGPVVIPFRATFLRNPAVQTG